MESWLHSGVTDFDNLGKKFDLIMFIIDLSYILLFRDTVWNE